MVGDVPGNRGRDQGHVRLSQGLKVEGLRELQSALRKLPPEYRKELAAIHKKAAEPVAHRAVTDVPVRSGRLQSSIRPLGSQRRGQVAAGGSRVPYAGPIHYGWPARNIEPQPFLTDALHREEVTVTAIFETETDRLIDKVWAFARSGGTR